MSTPSPTYLHISKMVSALLAHCEQHNIVVWPEYGTLLGWKRHGGVIPWDYDADFGILSAYKDTLLTTFSHPDYILDPSYYQDDGCMVLRSRDDTITVVDIIFYAFDGPILKSLQNATTLATYACPYNYCYPAGWWAPLTIDTLLGHRIWIPAAVEKILTLVYGEWQTPPPEFAHYVHSKYLTSPCQTIPSEPGTNTVQLLEKIRDSTTPFILRNSPLLSCDTPTYQSAICTEPEVFGYTSSITWDHATTSGTAVWQDYLAGTLKINIVDSPVTNTAGLNTDLLDHITNDGWLREHAICWTLANSPKTTAFHVDPDYAGGYMKLREGEKIWWCIVEDDWKYLEARGHSLDSFKGMGFLDILALEDYYLWGKIRVGILHGGDLIWFPKRCLHAVITTRDSCGFSGYL